jgi:thioredoxin-dependent peroxiredoxin
MTQVRTWHQAVSWGIVRTMPIGSGKPKVGDEAPAFDVVSSEGKRVRLEDYKGKKNVVLYFYPKDFTPVCTAEACGFRDMYDTLAGKDTEVIGVSMDSDGSHKDFAAKHQVPFPLISDPEGKLARSYGATGTLVGLLGMTKRITYVIDKQGKIVAMFDSAFRANQHLDGVKSALASLS